MEGSEKNIKSVIQIIPPQSLSYIEMIHKARSWMERVSKLIKDGIHHPARRAGAGTINKTISRFAQSSTISPG